jgi:MraZ protein
VEGFLSQYVRSFDAKGRVSAPAPFRAVLAKEGFEGVFVHPCLEAPALDCGGARLLGSIRAMLDTLPAYSREREDLSLALLGAGEIVKLDSEGRMLLSDRVREEIGARDEVSFVGLGDKFQLWEPGRFAARLAEARARAVRARNSDRGARE